MKGLGLALGLSRRGSGEPPEDAAPNISAVNISPASGVVGQTFTATIVGTGYPSSGKTYQWELDGVEISGATSQSYTTIAAGALTCVGSWDNGVGAPASLESGSVTVSVPDAVNTVLPAITGTGKIGSEHTVSNGTWTGGTGTFTYQWYLDAVAISGATIAAYTPVEADGGGTLTCTVTEQPGSVAATSAGLAISYAAPIAVGDDTWAETENTGNQTFDASALFTVAGDLDLSSVTGFTFVLLPGGSVFADGVFEAGVFESGGGSGYLTINASTGLVTLDTNTSGLLSGVDFTVRCTNPSGSADATITLTVASASGTGIGAWVIGTDFTVAAPEGSIGNAVVGSTFTIAA